MDRSPSVCGGYDERIGGCGGSTGPSSTDPETGRPYGSRFPKVTIRDMVRAQQRCLLKLGIDRLEAVIGGSMGGMLSLEWAIMFPEQVKKCIPIATGATLSSLSVAYNEIGRQAIITDPMWQGGDYNPGTGTRQWLVDRENDRNGHLSDGKIV